VIVLTADAHGVDWPIEAVLKPATRSGALVPSPRVISVGDI